VTRNGDAAVSCSTDCTVRLWRVPYAPFESGSVEAEDRSVLQFHGSAAFKCAVCRSAAKRIACQATTSLCLWPHVLQGMQSATTRHCTLRKRHHAESAIPRCYALEPSGQPEQQQRLVLTGP